MTTGSALISRVAPPYRETLAAKKRQLLEELSLESSRLAVYGRVADDDQPPMLHDQFVTMRQQGMTYQTLKLVDAALERLAAGDFGACLACGGAISNGRLNAIPWAEYCIRCQEDAVRREEKAGGRAA
jgi:DnaK suppressor protein